MRELYYTPEQVAERLSVHPNTVRLWLRQGRMSGVRAGRLWRVRESDLQAFLAQEPEHRTDDKGEGNERGTDTD